MQTYFCFARLSCLSDSAGIRRVIYIEPYPKSKAKELRDDSVSVDPQSPSTTLVNFEPFEGIAPAKYMELFEGADLRKEDDGAFRTGT